MSDGTKRGEDDDEEEKNEEFEKEQGGSEGGEGGEYNVTQLSLSGPAGIELVCVRVRVGGCFKRCEDIVPAGRGQSSDIIKL